jgi:hypothetical protein
MSIAPYRVHKFVQPGVVSLLTALAIGCGDDGEARQPEQRADGAVSDAATLDAGSIDASPQADARSEMHDATQSGDAAPSVDAAELADDAQALPPTSAFTLSDTSGSGTLWVKADSTATQGSAAITETLYDWGEGSGFAAADSHRYTQPGAFTVRQQVRDALGATASSNASVTLHAFVPVRFSKSDLAPNMRVSEDGFQVENRSSEDGTVTGVVRTDSSIAPGSGVFYVEGSLHPDVRVGGFGLGTAAAPLTEGSGGNAESLGYEAYGPLRSAGSTCSGELGIDGNQRLVGYVIDYRAGSPVVHYMQLAAGNVAVRASCTMAVTAPLFATYWSERATVGYEGRINTGADIVNAPFTYGADALRSALTAAGQPEAAAALVLGFGKSRAARKNAAPTLQVPDTAQGTLGQPITIHGSATDVEDGSLDGAIRWADRSSLWHARVTGTGAAFTFTPSAIGLHPIEVTVEDLDGGKATKLVNVTVTGSLPTPNPVQLVLDGTSGEGVSVSSDGLSARFAGPGKDGVKANQGIFGTFWYFEVHRNNPVRNMGLGLIVQEGSLNPYRFDDVPWSVSMNTYGGTWRELMPFTSYTGMAGDTDYGWAVDYRAEHPKVYLIVRGTLIANFDLTEISTPLYPMLYGNAAYPDAPGWDMTVNFGTTPFAIDAKAILSGAGVDVSAMKLGWGVHAQ